MHGVLASCLVSCATTIAINLLIRRRRPQTAASPQRPREPQQQQPSEPAERDGCVDDIQAAAGHDQDAKDFAIRQQPAAQDDDDFHFTPHKTKPARSGEHLLPPGMAPFALQSPINTTKRADPYDPAPRSG
jgi:hypothetical protein